MAKAYGLIFTHFEIADVLIRNSSITAGEISDIDLGAAVIWMPLYALIFIQIQNSSFFT